MSLVPVAPAHDPFKKLPDLPKFDNTTNFGALDFSYIEGSSGLTFCSLGNGLNSGTYLGVLGPDPVTARVFAFHAVFHFYGTDLKCPVFVVFACISGLAYFSPSHKTLTFRSENDDAVKNNRVDYEATNAVHGRFVVRYKPKEDIVVTFVEDIYTETKKLYDLRTQNLSTVATLQKEIDDLDKMKKDSTDRNSKRAILVSHIDSLYHTGCPDGKATDPYVQIDELRSLSSSSSLENLLHELRRFVPDAENYEDGLNKLEKLLKDYEKEIKDLERKNSTSKALLDRWVALKRNHCPGSDVSKTLSSNDIAKARQFLLNVNDSVPDISSELQLFGLLKTTADTWEKNYRDRAADNKRKEKSAADALAIQIIINTLNHQIKTFKCDTSALEDEKRRREKDKRKKEGKYRYDNNPGSRLQFYHGQQCHPSRER